MVTHLLREGVKLLSVEEQRNPLRGTFQSCALLGTGALLMTGWISRWQLCQL